MPKHIFRETSTIIFYTIQYAEPCGLINIIILLILFPNIYLSNDMGPIGADCPQIETLDSIFCVKTTKLDDFF